MPKLHWETMAEYFGYVKKQGLSHNMVNLAGHGTTRISMRGLDPSPMNDDEISELISLLDASIDEGAHGISLGLQYAPGIFSTMDELKKVALLAKKKKKIITVHVKALSSISSTYPLKPFGKAHNLIALEEMINLARETGVKLQISHLIFVGQKSWKTIHKALEIIDKARHEGIDVMFDTYGHSCGASVATVILPEWFMAAMPGCLNKKSMVERVRLLAWLSFKLLGFGFEDIQIASGNSEKYNPFNGLFITDIANEMKSNPFDTYIDIIKESNGTARVLMHGYSNDEIIIELMKHEASLFMTDAWGEPQGVQNPGAYGCFPRFLELARDRGALTIEETVQKMTGANAERIGLKKRGTLKKGNFADITVFDPETICDNTTVEKTDAAPSGIESVFINGVQVLKKGKVDEKKFAGEVL